MWNSEVYVFMLFGLMYLCYFLLCLHWVVCWSGVSGRRAEHDLFLDWIVSGNVPAASREDTLGNTMLPSDPAASGNFTVL